MKKYLNLWWITDVVLAGIAILIGMVSGDWLSQFVLVPITLSLLMLTSYFT
jgi:hypothetical protein